ncbi:uncharacterized [Tachysurus ichikawai]
MVSDADSMKSLSLPTHKPLLTFMSPLHACIYIRARFSQPILGQWHQTHCCGSGNLAQIGLHRSVNRKQSIRERKGERHPSSSLHAVLKATHRGEDRRLATCLTDAILAFIFFSKVHDYVTCGSP